MDVRDSHALSTLLKPPSVVVKELFTANNGKIEGTMIDDIAKSVLLPPEECRMWLEHLRTVVENRRRGARKAAENRQARLQVNSGPSTRRTQRITISRY